MEGGETSPCNDCVAHDPTTGPRCWCHDRTLCQRRPKMDPLATGAIGGQGSPGVDTSTVQRDFRLGICAATHSQHAGPRKDRASPCRVEGGYARPLMPLTRRASKGTSGVMDTELCARPIAKVDAAALIGVLAVLQSRALAGDLDGRIVARLSER